MVLYKSTDGVFDGPVEKVWKLIQAHSPENVGNIQKGYSQKLLETKPNGQMVVDLTSPGPDGRPTTSRIRFTPTLPTSLLLEWTSGPLAGSWCINSYFPQGTSKTKVETFGEFRITGMDDASTLKMINEFLDHSFTEDNNYLRTSVR